MAIVAANLYKHIPNKICRFSPFLLLLNQLILIYLNQRYGLIVLPNAFLH